MPDIATISAFLSSVKTATEIAKALREVDVSLEKAETKLKIADLMDALAEARIKAAEIQDVIQEKDKRIAELESAFETKAKLIRQEDAYFEINASGNPFGAPYCSHCWEVNHKPIHLHRERENMWDYVCPACKNSYSYRHVPDFNRPLPT
jgi:CRISPR/Cas system-associated protein Cas10 (large subunit of type III CRISPR-Cas system)